MPTSVGDLNYITVHGTYEDFTGTPIFPGSIVFKPSVTILDPGSDLILVPKTFTAVLAGDGSFSIDLPATDDPDVTPVGWTYAVTESFSGGRTFNISVPISSAGGSVSLASLAPVDSASGTQNFVLLSDFNAQLADLSGTYSPVPSASPPVEPVVNQLWSSVSLKDLRVGPGRGDRAKVIAPTLSVEASSCQEPSVWVANGRYNVLYTVGGGGLAYAWCSDTEDPTVAANWTKTDAIVLGQGAGGFAGAVAHAAVYVEGATLYTYFPDGNDIRVATAAIADPTTWATQAAVVFSAPAGVTTMGGNPFVVLDGTDYRMTFDFLDSEGLGWQTGIATGASPTGVFAATVYPLTSLRAGSGGRAKAVGGCWLAKEGSTWVLYFHAMPPVGLPSDIYRAFNDDLTADTWTLDNNGYPIIRRVAVEEVDQVADVTLVESPNGQWYAFWTGADNTTAFNIMAAPMLPTVKRWDGSVWQPTDFRGATTVPINAPAPRLIQWHAGFDLSSRATGSWASNITAATVSGTNFGYPLFNNNSNAQNDAFEVDLFGFEPGDWELAVIIRQAFNQADLRVDLDDGAGGFFTNLGTIDGYNSGVVDYVRQTLSFTLSEVEPARRTVRFQANTRNGAASGWFMNVHAFQFRKLSR